MPSTYSRRTVLACCATGLGVGAAGCLGSLPADPTDDSGPATATEVASGGTGPNATTADPTPIPAGVVSDAEAKKRALAAEERYLKDRLREASCLQNWGTTPTTSSERATVTDRTADGVRVEVHHPYSYSTDRTEADLASTARYVVTADAVRRVDGDEVSPC
ncbi:hypothetical protein [Halorussus sp. AFM4]|uniref:hypothetical protein n=1 Tax=Halorussus sp. AFM4 TaxID=3421651 RepID=UPI003EB8366C